MTLGSPHLGAPLERYGSVFESLLPISSYSAPLARLGRIRSAGVVDMRYGLDLPLPAGVECHAVAAGRRPPRSDRERPRSISGARCSVVPGVSHLDLLSSPDAYDTIRRGWRGELERGRLRLGFDAELRPCKPDGQRARLHLVHDLAPLDLDRDLCVPSAAAICC